MLKEEANFDFYILQVSDYPGGFVVIKSHFGRMHMFASEGKDEIVKRLQEAAMNFTGLLLRKKEPIKLETFQTQKFGRFSDDEYITSISEFIVQKLSTRRLDPVRRTILIFLLYHISQQFLKLQKKILSLIVKAEKK